MGRLGAVWEGRGAPARGRGAPWPEACRLGGEGAVARVVSHHAPWARLKAGHAVGKAARKAVRDAPVGGRMPVLRPLCSREPAKFCAALTVGISAAHHSREHNVPYPEEGYGGRAPHKDRRLPKV